MFFSHRFLIFPNMGQSLQSVMEEENKLLSEKAVLHIACRIVGVNLYFFFFFFTIFLILASKRSRTHEEL